MSDFTGDIKLKGEAKLNTKEVTMFKALERDPQPNCERRWRLNSTRDLMGKKTTNKQGKEKYTFQTVPRDYPYEKQKISDRVLEDLPSAPSEGEEFKAILAVLEKKKALLEDEVEIARIHLLDLTQRVQKINECFKSLSELEQALEE